MESPNLPSGWPCPPWTHTQRGTPPSEMCVNGWTLPRPPPPRLHQALPQRGAPRHPEDPDPLKPAHSEHFPSKQTSLARHQTPDRGDTCLTRVRDSKVRSYPLCKSSETPTFKDTMVRSTSQSAVCLTGNPRNGPDRESQVPTARTPRTTRATVAESAALMERRKLPVGSHCERTWMSQSSTA